MTVSSGLSSSPAGHLAQISDIANVMANANSITAAATTAAVRCFVIWTFMSLWSPTQPASAAFQPLTWCTILGNY